jgi:hypothetical protein
MSSGGRPAKLTCHYLRHPRTSEGSVCAYTLTIFSLGFWAAAFLESQNCRQGAARLYLRSSFAATGPPTVSVRACIPEISRLVITMAFLPDDRITGPPNTEEGRSIAGNSGVRAIGPASVARLFATFSPI